jgi:hypothetical protein
LSLLPQDAADDSGHCRAYLLKQHGKKAMSDAEKQRNRQLDQMTQRALALVHERRAAGSVH